MPAPVLVTASTHLGEWQLGFADRHWIVTRPEDTARFAGQIEGVTLFTGPAGEASTDAGIEQPNRCRRYWKWQSMLHFPVLIEADGSRQRPLKAPGEDEPVIPELGDAGSGHGGAVWLGAVLDASTVHRPERFAEISGLQSGALISEEGLARALLHAQGGMKNIPFGCAESAAAQPGRRRSTGRGWNAHSQSGMVAGYFDSVIIAALAQRQIRAVIEPVAGIILAAGRVQPVWAGEDAAALAGKPLVRHAAEAALAGGLSPVVVILGSENEGVRQALAGLRWNLWKTRTGCTGKAPRFGRELQRQLERGAGQPFFCWQTSRL
jgi:molybdenum cofactor cytidylyltransferase